MRKKDQSLRVATEKARLPRCAAWPSSTWMYSLERSRMPEPSSTWVKQAFTKRSFVRSGTTLSYAEWLGRLAGTR